uniref:Pre-mRNA splicing Prp18-interacting factor n=1 Tax=Tanacetum cinerariifolium TaxID=118510 RepID=A0A699GSR1_TANCI|nr:hypothetical protein [Tanacetum cinerariifolium]
MSLFHQRKCRGCDQPCDGYYCDSCTCIRCGVSLFNGTCNNCIYGDGKPLTCCTCGGILRGGFCFPCNFKAENSYNCYQDAYSFNDPSNNSNHFPRPQNENHLCNLCGNNSHDGYDCQQQFPFVYEQEPSYNQNYNDNYYSHDLPSFLCCDNRGGSHETFQCQPIDQNIDFSGSDQIQTPQYPDVHPPSQETKYKESLENSSKEIAVSNSNEEKEDPPQDSDIHQLNEECSMEVSEEQKQKMEDTILELVKICQEKEFLCIHDNVDDLIESALNSKLLLINSNSQRLNKKQQEVKNVIEWPVKCGNRKAEHLLSMGYEHLSITPETEFDEVTESNAENLLPIPSKCKVTLEDEIECDMAFQDQSFSAFTTFSNHLFKNDDLDSSDDESLPDEDNLLYDNSSPRPPEELNAEIADTIIESIPLLPIPIQDGDSQREGIDIVPETDDVLPLSVENDDDSLNDPLLEEADLFFAFDNSIPLGIENVADDPEGDIRFLKELLIDDSILSHKSSDFEDNPSIPRPPLEPPDAETDV